MVIRKPLVSIFVAIAVALPGIAVAIARPDLPPPLLALVSGAAIMGAAFVLLWACDAAQADVSQAFAIAVLALVGVLPEYAVDLYFTWQAGQHPESDYAHYAIANMTGANRLIIGVAWVIVVAIYWLKTRRSARLERERGLEIRFLAAATLYAFLIPVKGNLAWYDGLVFVGLYGWYITVAARRPQTHHDAGGPGAYLASLPRTRRRAATISLFLFSAGAILANAEHFSEGLVHTGKALGINEFLLVQWLAPIASEAPEFVVAIVFALRRQVGLALGALVSAKLNQWTLLVGMIPFVFAASAGTLQHPLPMSGLQLHEVLLTAAQSLLAVTMLALLRLTVGQALLLFVLFAGQLIAPPIVDSMFSGEVLGIRSDQLHPLFTAFYLVATLALIAERPQRLAALWHVRVEPADLPEEEPVYEVPLAELTFADGGESPIADGASVRELDESLAGRP